MVDFSKKIGKVKVSKKIDPIELYESLDRATDKGPLRPVQTKILKDWYKNFFDSKEVILKLHTGQGKTLTGLLMLQSLLNKGKGPVVYLCPNNYLVEQTCIQAESFGFNYCVYDKDIPDDFTNEKSILITNVQTLFNGKTKFGTGKQFTEIATILMDDSHACIDAIKDACRIELDQGSGPYQEILELFAPELEKQGVGTFADIQRQNYDSFLMIPYWDWHDKHADVARILSKHSNLNKIKFSWEILKDLIRDCDCFISGNKLEIIPYSIPLHMFGSYYNAEQKIFMSATVNDDSFLIKGLGLESNTIKNPLHIENEKWSGEKMILIPSLIDPSLDRSQMVKILGSRGSEDKVNRIGIVTLTPSFKRTQDWKKYGAVIAKKETLNQEIEKLKNKDSNKTLVIANRYDGIDLPDGTCRVLTLDSAPHTNSLYERYLENCRSNSDIIQVKKAQKIEQGLGRSVRGEKDYSVINIIGTDLIKLMRSKKSIKYFSTQTKTQIELGFEIATFAKEEIEEGKDPLKAFIGLINQLIKRDEGWKQFYSQKMDEMSPDGSNEKILEIFVAEKDALDQYMLGNYKKSTEIIQKLMDIYQQTDEEKGWYLQEMAKYMYPFSKSESNKLQVIAHRHNRYLLKPKEGMEFQKITKISQRRIEVIKKLVESYSSYEDLNIDLNAVLDSLRFGVNADKFENSFNELGRFLGFLSERPDKEWKEGPDNLWMLGNNNYLIAECKNQVELGRKKINKDESGQMNNASRWFEKNYGDVNVTRVLIIPTKNLNKSAGFNQDVKIMRQKNLIKLVKNIQNFYSEFKTVDLNSLSEEQLQKNINTHLLTTENLKNMYYESPKEY